MNDAFNREIVNEAGVLRARHLNEAAYHSRFGLRPQAASVHLQGLPSQAEFAQPQTKFAGRRDHQNAISTRLDLKR